MNFTTSKNQIQDYTVGFASLTVADFFFETTEVNSRKSSRRKKRLKEHHVDSTKLVVLSQNPEERKAQKTISTLSRSYAISPHWMQ